MLNKLMRTLGERSYGKGIAYAILSYVLWGILPLFWKALKQIDASEILASRILWSFVFLLLILLTVGGLRDLQKVFSSAKTILSVFIGSLLITANWFIYIWAVNNNHVIEASLGYYINPLFTVVLGIVVLKERIDKWQVVSLLLALLGVIVITVQYGKMPWVALLLAISFGLYGLVKKLSDLTSIIGLTAETMIIAPIALGYIVYQQVEGTSTLTALPLNVLILVVLTGIVTAIPLLLFAQAAKCVSLSTIGFIQYLSPSITLLMGIFLFKEVFTGVDFMSFGLIWLALGIYSFSRKDFLDAMFKKQYGKVA
ncbi:MAG: EamA family transporter RarD [Desulfosporosinus fructosivorans]